MLIGLGGAPVEPRGDYICIINASSTLSAQTVNIASEPSCVEMG